MQTMFLDFVGTFHESFTKKMQERDHNYIRGAYSDRKIQMLDRHEDRMISGFEKIETAFNIVGKKSTNENSVRNIITALNKGILTFSSNEVKELAGKESNELQRYCRVNNLQELGIYADPQGRLQVFNERVLQGALNENADRVRIALSDFTQGFKSHCDKIYNKFTQSLHDIKDKAEKLEEEKRRINEEKSSEMQEFMMNMLMMMMSQLDNANDGFDDFI